MKAIAGFLSCIMIMAVMSCGATRQSDNYQPDTLTDVLRRVSGLSVIGAAEHATIRVRGLSESQGSGEPLFVVDGREIMGGYTSLYQSLHPDDIISVRVLRHPTDLYKYGKLGVNGVVEIRTI